MSPPMASRTWITGELAFAGQVLDNHTENCAIHVNETINLLEELLGAHIKVKRDAATLPGPAAGPAEPVLAPVESAQNPAPPKSEIVLQKRSCMSPSRSPVHKKVQLHQSPLRRPVHIPGSHTARRAASRHVQPTTNPLPRPVAAKTSRSVSPIKSQMSLSPRKPLGEVSNLSKADAKQEKNGQAPSPRKKERELTGLARLLLPTSASAARIHPLRTHTENCDSPLLRKNDLDANATIKTKHAANATRVASEGSATGSSDRPKPAAPLPKRLAAVPVRLQVKLPAKPEEIKPAVRAQPAVSAKPSPPKTVPDQAMPPPNIPMPKLKIPLTHTFAAPVVAQQKIQVVGLPPVLQAEATLPDISDSSEGSILQQWAYTPEVAERIRRQVKIDPVSVFGPIKPVQMDAIFKRRMRPRTSSAVWDLDGLTPQERQKYNDRMGFDA